MVQEDNGCFLQQISCGLSIIKKILVSHLHVHLKIGAAKHDIKFFFPSNNQ